jgi:glycosyltransferase involved in cell wall biosynthesis
MRIVYVITKAEWGGAQAYVYELIKHQCEINNNVCLIVGCTGELVKRIKETKLSCQIKILHELKRNLSPTDDLKAIFLLRRMIKRLKPDIVHLNSSKAGAVGRLACVGLSCKVVFTVHGWAFTEGVSSKKAIIYKLVEKVLYRFCDLIICVSKYDLNLAIKTKVVPKDTDKVKVIYNGVKVPDTEKKCEKNDRIYSVMTARFDTQKNYELLIKAIADCEFKWKFEFHFIGDGPNLEKCKVLVKRLGLTNIIYFEEFQKDVGSFLKKADLFILCSNYEGLPISIIEAMSYGLPILASDVGGISEQVINEYNGYLFMNDINSIEKVLKKIYQLEDLNELCSNSKNLFTKKFNLSNKLNNLDNEYNNILLK